MTAAARQKRRRARERDGRTVVGVEIDHAVVTEELIRAGFLSEADIDNRDKIGEALAKVIEVLCVTRDYDAL